MPEKTEYLWDYLRWRGDLTPEQSQLRPVDFLIFSTLAYTPLEEAQKAGVLGKLPSEWLTPYLYPQPPKEDEKQLARQRYTLWKAAVATPRFGLCQVERFACHFDEKEGTQFAAVLFRYKDTGILAYRGTDATLVGWHEDFRLSFESPIPAQRDALAFLEQAESSVKELYLCGHSKGGNLAMYAAVHASAPIRNKILGVYNYDGPGLDDATLALAAENRMEDKIYSFLPESSVIGKLLGYQDKHILIASDSVSVMQHNPFFWHLKGPAFETAPESTVSSELADRSLHRFLLNCDTRQRQVLIDTLFSILSLSGAKKTSDVMSGLMEHRPQVSEAIAKVPAEDRKLIWDGLKALLEAFGSTTTQMLGGVMGKFALEYLNGKNHG